MFKDDKITPISDNNFGAGSVVVGNRDTYLVVRLNDTTVAIIDDVEFKQIGNAVQVRDPNYLTQAEARELVDQVGDVLNWTFTDFDLKPKGRKGKNF